MVSCPSLVYLVSNTAASVNLISSDPDISTYPLWTIYGPLLFVSIEPFFDFLDSRLSLTTSYFLSISDEYNNGKMYKLEKQKHLVGLSWSL